VPNLMTAAAAGGDSNASSVAGGMAYGYGQLKHRPTAHLIVNALAPIVGTQSNGEITLSRNARPLNF